MTEKLKQIGLDLDSISEDALDIILWEGAVDAAFFSDVFSANRNRPAILKLLLNHYSTPEEIRIEASGILNLPVPAQTALQAAKKEKEGKPPEEKKQTLLQCIQRMNVGERIHLAIRGGREVRNLLLKDSNKEVLRMVMSNPKITESEIELITINRNTPEEILRIISKSREWTKNYSILFGLVTNPKTPPGLAVKFVPRIKKADLPRLERNKNIPELVRGTVKRILSKTRY